MLKTSTPTAFIIGHTAVLFMAALALWALAAERHDTFPHAVAGYQPARTQAVLRLEFLKREAEAKARSAVQFVQQHLASLLLKYGAAVQLLNALIRLIRFAKTTREYLHRLRQRLLAWRQRAEPCEPLAT